MRVLSLVARRGLQPKFLARGLSERCMLFLVLLPLGLVLFELGVTLLVKAVHQLARPSVDFGDLVTLPPLNG